MSPDIDRYGLRLGQVVVELVCPEAKLVGALEAYFGRASDPAPGDVSVRLNLVERDGTDAVPSSLILAKQVSEHRFDIAQGLIHGVYDPATGEGDLHVDAALTRGLMTRVFEQILYQAFPSAVQRTGWDAALVHSSGVVRDGAGFLFVGPSEAGKSTIADLSRDAKVLNDEMNLVEFRPDGPWLHPSPFNGHYRDKSDATAPVAAILLPAKGAEHRLEHVGAGEAAAAIATQVAPPVALHQAADAATPSAMLETAVRLAESVPVRRLVFLRDAGFWPLLADAFIPQQRG